MLHQRQQIGDDLAGVRAIGEAVDDGDMRMMRQLLGLGVIVRADHDRIHHAAQHARGVGNAFPSPQLAGTGIEDQGRTAQLAHADVETHSRARRCFFEDHPQHMASQRSVGVSLALGPSGACSLPVDRVADHGRDRIAARIGQVEEVPHTHPAAAGS